MIFVLSVPLLPWLIACACGWMRWPADLRVAADIVNQQLWITDRCIHLSCRLGEELMTPHCKKCFKRNTGWACDLQFFEVT